MVYVIDPLSQGNSPCTFERRSMLLGALIQETQCARKDCQIRLRLCPTCLSPPRRVMYAMFLDRISTRRYANTTPWTNIKAQSPMCLCSLSSLMSSPDFSNSQADTVSESSLSLDPKTFASSSVSRTKDTNSIAPLFANDAYTQPRTQHLAGSNHLSLKGGPNSCHHKTRCREYSLAFCRHCMYGDKVQCHTRRPRILEAPLML